MEFKHADQNALMPSHWWHLLLAGSTGCSTHTRYVPPTLTGPAITHTSYKACPSFSFPQLSRILRRPRSLIWPLWRIPIGQRCHIRNGRLCIATHVCRTCHGPTATQLEVDPTGREESRMMAMQHVRFTETWVYGLDSPCHIAPQQSPDHPTHSLLHACMHAAVQCNFIVRLIEAYSTCRLDGSMRLLRGFPTRLPLPRAPRRVDQRDQDDRPHQEVAQEVDGRPGGYAAVPVQQLQGVWDTPPSGSAVGCGMNALATLAAQVPSVHALSNAACANVSFWIP